MDEQLDLFRDTAKAAPRRRKRQRPKLRAVPAAKAPPPPPPPPEPEPVGGELVPFPAACLTSRVRALALKLRSLREEEDRNDAWRAALKSIRIEMLRVGIPPEIVKAEMQQFAEAVREEYWRPPDLGRPFGQPYRRA